MVVYLLKKWRGPMTRALLWLLDMAALNGALLGRLPAARRGSIRCSPRTCSRSPTTGRSSASRRCSPPSPSCCAAATAGGASGARPSLAAAGPLVGLVALLLLATTYLTHQQVFSRAVLLLFVPLFWLALGAVGAAFAALRARLERGRLSLERTLLVGPAARVSAWLAAGEDPRRDGLDPVGYVCEPEPGGPEPAPLGDGDLPWLGGRGELRAAVLRHRVSQVVFWEWPAGEREGVELLGWLSRQHIRLRWLLEDGGVLASGARPEPFAGASSLVLEPRMDRPWRARWRTWPTGPPACCWWR